MNLASHITHWPVNATHAVVFDGEISFSKGGAPKWNGRSWTVLEGAGDSVYWHAYSGKKMGIEWQKESHIVTRAQWEAERARIASDKPNAEPESGQRTQYEQELWDKAYLKAWELGLEMIAHSADEEAVHTVTSGSARMADAFMAERAKRMKG